MIELRVRACARPGGGSSWEAVLQVWQDFDLLAENFTTGHGSQQEAEAAAARLQHSLLLQGPMGTLRILRGKAVVKAAKIKWIWDK